MGQRHTNTDVAQILTEKSHSGRGPLDALQNLGLFIGSSVKAGYPLLFLWEEPGFSKENNYVTAPSPNLNNPQSYWFTILDWEWHWVLQKGIRINQGFFFFLRRSMLSRMNLVIKNMYEMNYCGYVKSRSFREKLLAPICCIGNSSNLMSSFFQGMDCVQRTWFSLLWLNT